MTIAWVLGGSGLLGSALCRALRSDGTELFSPAARFRWTSEAEVGLQIAAAVETFAEAARARDRWEIYWAAGVGTMGSTDHELAPETRTLALMLALLGSQRGLMALPGAVAFASTAGAIYAGAPDHIISEHTRPAPTTAYGRVKLKHEESVRLFAAANKRTTAVIARLSTLYGPGQSLGKKQGLLAHIARCILRNQPIQIYVPLDTIRDYIAADDAATLMVAALRATGEQTPVLTKIIASEQPATIAEIVSIFKRITRRAPKIVTSATELSEVYSRRVQFRSVVHGGHVRAPRTTLLVGIAQVMAAERALFVRRR